jgi:hypothetical protein
MPTGQIIMECMRTNGRNAKFVTLAKNQKYVHDNVHIPLYGLSSSEPLLQNLTNPVCYVTVASRIFCSIALKLSISM